MNGIFVTGTDTGVGKTVVSSILSVGLKASYWTVQTGASERDSDFVCRWTDDIIKESYALREPLSPHRAAALEGVRISLSDIAARSRSLRQFTIVEGAGGVLVPLNEKEMMIDLMEALALPTILVARSGLGTINHTLLSARALRDRGLLLLGVVLVGDPNAGNRQAIEDYSGLKVVGEVPICSSFTAEWMQQQFAGLTGYAGRIENEFG